jgi:hypothetical protein
MRYSQPAAFTTRQQLATRNGSTQLDEYFPLLLVVKLLKMQAGTLDASVGFTP